MFVAVAEDALSQPHLPEDGPEPLVDLGGARSDVWMHMGSSGSEEASRTATQPTKKEVLTCPRVGEHA